MHDPLYIASMKAALAQTARFLDCQTYFEAWDLEGAGADKFMRVWGSGDLGGFRIGITD